MGIERELRRLVDATTVVAKRQRRTIGEAGEAYIAHLEKVMEGKRTTIADYHGQLRRHLAPFFTDRPMDRLESLELAPGGGMSPQELMRVLEQLPGELPWGDVYIRSSSSGFRS